MNRKAKSALILGVVLVAGWPAFEAATPPVSAQVDPKQAKPELIELGRRLFMDPTASREGKHSCASCHDPEKAFSDTRPRSPDDAGPTARHSQTLLDLAGEGFHWDGEFETVRQLLVARVAPREMADRQARDLARKRRAAARSSFTSSPTSPTSPDSMDCGPRGFGGGYGGSTPDSPTTPITPVADRLLEDGRYARAFKDAFGDDAVTIDRVLDAMDAYCASIRSTTNAFDRFRAGDGQALSAPAKRGLALFEGKAGCAQCHLTAPTAGRASFTDGRFHNTGVADHGLQKAVNAAGEGPPPKLDTGRAAVTLRREEIARFKTPTLRDVALRAPYMHDASFATLADVVRYYSDVASADGGKDPAIRRLDLSDDEVGDLVAFLESLTGAKRAALALPRNETKPLRVRVENLAGNPVPDLPIDVEGFGDRLEGADEIEVPWRAVTDKSGVATIRRPLTTHMALTNSRNELGLTRPIPDSAESITLVATPLDMVSLRVRRTADGPSLPREIKAYTDDAALRIANGSPSKPTVLLKLVRQISSREALYAAKAPPRSTVRRVSLVVDASTTLQCELDLAGGASKTILLDRSGGR